MRGKKFPNSQFSAAVLLYIMSVGSAVYVSVKSILEFVVSIRTLSSLRISAALIKAEVLSFLQQPQEATKHRT